MAFSYPTAQQFKVCKGLALEVQPGQVCALCGPSGSGKSTVIALLQVRPTLTLSPNPKPNPSPNPSPDPHPNPSPSPNPHQAFSEHLQLLLPSLRAPLDAAHLTHLLSLLPQLAGETAWLGLG